MGSLKENVKEKGHADQQRYALAMNAIKNEGTGLRVLELGCDDGTFAWGFAQLGHKVTAIDLDCSEAIDIHSHENIEYVEKNVEDTDYLNEEFDIVHAGEILEHVENPDKLMKLICYLSKNNGLIMISVPNFKHPQHLRTYTRRSFEKLLKEYSIEGTILTIKHDLARKRGGKTERYAIYGGRISKNQEERKISKVAALHGRCLSWLKRATGIKKKDLYRRGGKVTEREIEYAFLFNHLHLSPGYRLLEVGAGRSGLALVLAHCGYSVTTIDLKPEHPWVTKGDATQLSFNDNSFDVVISLSVFKHIPDSDRAIEQILRVVVPGGIIILSFPYNPIEMVKDIYKKVGHKAGYICSIYNDKKIGEWFDKRAEIVAVDYWWQWSGELWREGTKSLRASRVSKEQAQGICIAVRKL
jgi:2-polyprenyl-3-methyl-5-hydroxy-6-metoxy-1,4-benzoquinol methylase